MNMYIISTPSHIHTYNKFTYRQNTHTDEGVWDSTHHKPVTVTMLLGEVTWLQSCN